ncbi:hypothetical protein LZL87_005451 [Fusarium oxysporum]|uniref:Uncharacterized protein n=1 Tax=Fusarium oxysporum f. sp. rapae TaxID=485398 RepID=A0A8J5U0S6_FUSOX|nr:hypothetical protein Forpe1208_v000565 [Fusarium oxysporum f. sp. rapae]KAI7772726.1 hypothetical protein LZL87_005451 [Fusarium oxysporum]
MHQGVVLEANHQPSFNSKAAIERARDVMSHSDRPVQEGTTRDYDRILLDDMWKNRVYNPVLPPTVDTPHITANIYQSRKRTTEAITRECIDHGLGPN